jgi:hypothetical protein
MAQTAKTIGALRREFDGIWWNRRNPATLSATTTRWVIGTSNALI